MISSKKIEWDDLNPVVDPESLEVKISWECPFCKEDVVGLSCGCGAGLRVTARKDYGNNDKYHSGRKFF